MNQHVATMKAQAEAFGAHDDTHMFFVYPGGVVKLMRLAPKEADTILNKDAVGIPVYYWDAENGEIGVWPWPHPGLGKMYVGVELEQEKPDEKDV